MRTATLQSTYGTVVFDVDTGFVKSARLDREFGGRPFKIDVDEWRQRYPGEDMEGEHDVLDFGYWYYEKKPGAKRGRRNVEYEEPCEDWRKDREARIAEGGGKG